MTELSDKLASRGIDKSAAKYLLQIDFGDKNNRGVYAVHRDYFRELDLSNVKYNEVIHILNALWDGNPI